MTQQDLRSISPGYRIKPAPLVSLILGIAVLDSIWRTDRTTVVTPAGIEYQQP